MTTEQKIVSVTAGAKVHLRACASRLRKVEEQIRMGSPCPISNVYQPDPAFPSIADFQRDQTILANAYMDEHPADEDESVSEEWLSSVFGPHLASCPWKRYALHFATDKHGRLWGWCPQCGHLPPCLCIDEWVMIVAPSRGDVRLLCQALGVAIKTR